MSRALPYPVLTAALTLMWLLLNGFSLGHLILGGAVATGASWAMTSLHPAQPYARNWRAMLAFAGLVLRDIVASNVAVARVILSGRRHSRTAGFVSIPLELRDENALAVLACVLTSAPGTAWIEYRAATGHLLIHVLDLKDDQDWIDLVKKRYEPLLMEIFE
jgi:multicomponent K+:H+ antiporter subunit E